MISRSCNRIETFFVFRIARNNRNEAGFLPTTKLCMSKNDVNVYKQETLLYDVYCECVAYLHSDYIVMSGPAVIRNVCKYSR